MRAPSAGSYSNVCQLRELARHREHAALCADRAPAAAIAPAVQARVRAVAARHTRLADLAVSFPSLLFALALPRPDIDPGPAIARVIDGRPLREVAAAARLPLWLRRLPVDGLTRPLPTLPADELFGRRIVNHFPRSTKLTDIWVETVSGADYWINEPFAVWIGREFACDPKSVKMDAMLIVGLWAWFSQHPETEGNRLIETPWRIEMRYGVDAAYAWLQRLRLELNFGGQPIVNPWVCPGPFEGYDFVPLDSAERIDQEATAMANCIRTYGRRIARNVCRLWSIRKDGQRIANLAIARHGSVPLLHIDELSGPHNEAVPIEIWWLATRWLHLHDLVSIRPAPRDPPPPDTAVWRKVWRPYWLAKRRIPDWLPLTPTWRVVGALG